MLAIAAHVGRPATPSKATATATASMRRFLRTRRTLAQTNKPDEMAVPGGDPAELPLPRITTHDLRDQRLFTSKLQRQLTQTMRAQTELEQEHGPSSEPEHEPKLQPQPQTERRSRRKTPREIMQEASDEIAPSRRIAPPSLHSQLKWLRNVQLPTTDTTEPELVPKARRKGSDDGDESDLDEAVIDRFLAVARNAGVPFRRHVQEIERLRQKLHEQEGRTEHQEHLQQAADPVTSTRRAPSARSLRLKRAMKHQLEEANSPIAEESGLVALPTLPQTRTPSRPADNVHDILNRLATKPLTTKQSPSKQLPSQPLSSSKSKTKEVSPPRDDNARNTKRPLAAMRPAPGDLSASEMLAQLRAERSKSTQTINSDRNKNQRPSIIKDGTKKRFFSTTPPLQRRSLPLAERSRRIAAQAAATKVNDSDEEEEEGETLRDDVRAEGQGEADDVTEVDQPLEDVVEDQQSRKLSLAANFGDFRVGSEELPEMLQGSIKRVLANDRRRDLQKDYERISSAMRSWDAHGRGALDPKNTATSSPSQLSAPPTRRRRSRDASDEDDDDDEISVSKIKNGKTSPSERSLQYGPREASAYVAARLPAIYGVLTRVMQEAYFRLRKYRPESMLDFGTGPGTAIWAAHEIFGGGINEFLGIDTSEAMLRMAENLITDPKDMQHPAIKGTRFQRYLSPHTQAAKQYDLVVASYSIGELYAPRLRAATVEALWEYARDVLIFVEPGTPAGFKTILEIRNMFVDTGDYSAEAALGGRIPSTRLTPSHIVAPCAHHGPCPMPKTSWCHFIQRSQRSALMRHAKGVKRSYEDEKFSFLIIRRGPRPVVALEEQPLMQISTEDKEKTMDELERQSFGWSRILRQPMRRHRHVILDLCTPQGQFERRIVAASHGKQMYRDARNMFWGNLWPYPKPKGR